MSDVRVNPTADADDAEADAIEALRVRLASADAKRDVAAVIKVRDELSEALMRRTRRVTDENWDTLERLVGHRLRRG